MAEEAVTILVECALNREVGFDFWWARSRVLLLFQGRGYQLQVVSRIGSMVANTRVVVVADVKGKVYIYSTSTGEKKHCICPATGDVQMGLQDNLLVTACSSKVCIWNTNYGVLLHTLCQLNHYPFDIPSSVTISHKKISVGWKNSSIYIWDFKNKSKDSKQTKKGSAAKTLT